MENFQVKGDNLDHVSKVVVETWRDQTEQGGRNEFSKNTIIDFSQGTSIQQSCEQEHVSVSSTTKYFQTVYEGEFDAYVL